MRIRKSTRKVAPPPPDVDRLIKRITASTDEDLVSVLRPVQIWRFARGDMHAWVSVTQQLVRILTSMRDRYAFGAGSKTACKLQLGEFTPEDKDLVLESLRFIRLLMENCTNRKLFEGYDVINDLLLTNDLDVLEAALFVLLRPLQQYLNNMPTSSELSSSIRARLLALSRGWDRLALGGTDLVAYASSEQPLELSDDVAQLQLQFYPPIDAVSAPPALDLSPVKPTHHLSTHGSALETPTRPTLATARSESRVAATPLPAKVAPAVDSTMVTVDLGNVAETMPSDYLARLNKLADEYRMETDDQLSALNKIRVIVLTKDRDVRRQLLSCRLMALACFTNFSTEEAVQSSIFLYEPELVNQMAELLILERGVGDSVAASAILALDSASRHRQEVLTSINAHVSHGIIMNLLRSVAHKLSQGEEVHHELVDALIGFVAYINQIPFNGNLLVGAGLIPVLLEMLDTKGDRRVLYIPRACGLLDSALYQHPLAQNAFTAADGLNVFVSKIRAEIQMIQAEPIPEDNELESRDSLIAFNTQGLKAELRSIYRMLQSPGGTEAFRNVVDSDLPKSLKRIFTNGEPFGARNYSVAINIMSTIVHNEPTSLSILQEMQLPQTLYKELEANMPDTFEVAYALPTAIGAICLNGPGLQDTLDHFDVVSNLIKVAIAWKVEENERDNVATIGAALDELIRHHPQLRPKLLESVMGILREAIEAGEQFRPSPSEVNEYAVDPATVDTSMEVDMSASQDVTGATMNAPLTKLTNILKLLTGLLRNSTMCRDFIKDGGLDLVLCIADLPCIPVRFSPTEAAVAIPAVLRAIGEHDHIQLTERMVKAVKEDLERLPELWKDDNARSYWWAMLSEDGTTDDHARLRRAAGLAMRLSFLSEYLSLPFGSQRTGTALIKTLGVTSGSDLVSNLGLLHRVALQEHVIMKSYKADKPAEDAPVADAPAAAAPSAETPAEGASAEASTAAGAELPVNPTIQVVEASTEETSPTDVAKKVPPTRAGTVKTLVTRIHAILTKFFKASIRLIYNKRMPEAAYKQESAALAEVVSDIIIGHLTCSAQVPEHAFGIDTVSLGLSTILLFDERGAEGYISTTLFIPFDKKGGMGVMLGNIRRIVAQLDKMPDVPTEERTTQQRDQIAQCHAGIRIVVSVLNAFASPRSIIESPQTHVIEQREMSLPANKRFSSMNTFVRIRRDILPISRHIWMAEWLPTLPHNMLRLAIATFLEIMAGQHEEVEARVPMPEPEQPAVVRPAFHARPQLTADPARVAQLVDMGFGRNSAERALLRARNNVATATDLLLSMPHLFPEEPTTPAEPEAAAGDAAAADPGAEASAAAPGDAPTTTVTTPPNEEAGAPAAAEASSSAEAREAAMDVDPVPSPSTVYESQREELKKLRDEARPDLAPRALQLLDRVEDLVNDLLPAFPSGVEGANFVIDRIDEASKEEPRRNGAISARLRLLCVFARKPPPIELPVADSKRAMETIMALNVDTATPHPTYLATYLLAAESIFLMAYTVKDAKLGDEEPMPVVRAADFGDAPDRLLQICHNTLSAENVSREEMMSVLRLTTILTRHDTKRCGPELVSHVLSAFKKADSKLAGCQPFLAMIARHAFDTKDTLRDVMRREIREWMTPQRNKVTDVNHFVRQLRQMAFRDPESFMDAVSHECALVSPSPPQSVYHVRAIDQATTEEGKGKGKEGKGKDQDGKDIAKDKETGPAANDPFKSSTLDTFETHPVMDVLLGELGKSMRIIQQEEAAKRAGTERSAEATQAATQAAAEAYAYAGLIISLITELVGSYFSAKKAFVAGLRHGALYGAGKGKVGIAAIISDFICCVTLGDVQEKISGSNGADEVRRLSLSSWASSLVVALCAHLTPTTDLKEVPEDLSAVRKAVLDGIAKALKDSTHSHLDLNSRYGRLWALGELIFRLLTARPSVIPRPTDDSSLHLAKTMLEKNFVSLMTSAVSEIDLNYPDIRNVLISLLKALEHLTKISIKWGKSDKKKDGEEQGVDDQEEHHDDSETDDESDVTMSDDDGDQTPDLYRNSALGILGGDMDDDVDEDMDEEDMEDEEDLMEAFVDDMDHDMDDDEQDTEPSDDDDDDDDGDEDDMEGDWSTEDDGEDHDEDEPVVEIGAELEDMEDGVPWDEEGMMEGDDQEFDSEGEEEDGFMENEFVAGLDMEDGEDEMDDYDEDGEGYDEIDVMDGLPGSNGMRHHSSGRSAAMGHWGWQEPTLSSEIRGRPSLRDDIAAASLFGLPPRTSADNTQHPLLAGSRGSAIPGRTSTNPFGSLSNLNDLIASIEGLGGPQAVQFLENIVHHSRHAGAETIRVDLAHRQDGGFGLSIGGRSFNVAPPSSPRLPSTPEELQMEYKPRPTLQRWLEEANFFPYSSAEQIALLVVHLINRLMPAARKVAEEEAERQRKADEEAAAAEAKRREEEAALPTTIPLPDTRPTSALAGSSSDIGDEDIEMAFDDEDDDEDDSEDDDDESSEGDEEGDEAEEPAGPRVTIVIHGEEVDITDTGIDLEFLQALPEDMRADVVEQHLREQNRLTQPAASNVPSSSQINAEFLNALPPDIRAEVIMQESIDHSRRQPRIERDMFSAANPVPADLPAELRDMISGPASDLLNMLARDIGLPPPPGIAAAIAMPAPPRVKRDAIQLLDKPGIASLVRLLFFPEALRKGYLLRTLVHLCENSKTRVDLLNLLLSIVQDGSGDLPAVDRSFQQMSLRGLAATPKAAAQTPKGKEVQTPGTALTSGLFTHLQNDHIPTFIAQRCFEALSYIVGSNHQAVTYFLTEHEQPVGLRKPISKKGKGKEKFLPQTKFPIVILIGLLDRPNLLKTPGMMESLTGLLAAITKPLATLANKDKDPKAITDAAEAEAAKPPADNAAEGAPASTVTAPAAAGSAPPAVPSATATGPEAAAADGAPSTAVATTKPAVPELKAPVIPNSVLRLVVNCLTIGDCSSRTFSQTLVVLQNLSCIPNAKAILVEELCTRSQQLGATIQEELKELATVLADKDHELSPTVLAKFSPASSSQAQLLRLLKTLDYLYSRKATEANKNRGELSESEQQALDIYQKFDFSNMWRQLGDCLTLAEERESTEQIAAVLLPLVEALMVVSKHTQTTPAADAMSPLLSPTTPPPTDLFFSFTTTHRKVLNAIVRNNPSLMNGSFSLLIANPRVLEFDNKRNWFFLKLKRKRDQLAYPTLHLNVRRQYVFQDSFSALLHRPGDEVKYGKINVKFINEDGVDAGGVTREWFHVLAQQIFDPNFALFEPCAADKQTYQPNKHSSVVDDHLSFFKFVGRVIGKAIFDSRLLDAYFSRAFYKQILGRSVDMRDLESVDPEFHKSLQWMLDNDITDIIDQEFTIEDDSFGEKKIVELKPGGTTIPVTEENKAEYVRLVCAYRMENSIKEQMNAFLTGFYEIIPRHFIQIFEPDQLELLISGITTIDVDELKNSTQMSGWKSSDPEISWFWRALRSFSQEERSRFLMFVTSSSRVPLGGFSQLQGSSGTQPFQIQKLYGKEGILPQASTCFNLLLLPKYTSYEHLRERLLFAVTETSGFGKA